MCAKLSELVVLQLIKKAGFQVLGYRVSTGSVCYITGSAVPFGSAAELMGLVAVAPCGVDLQAGVCVWNALRDIGPVILIRQPRLWNRLACTLNTVL